jgi:hypothetical protein
VGGVKQDGNPCSDAAYLFDIEALIWYEVTNQALPLARYGHTACCQQVDEHTTHAILFGGAIKPRPDPQAISSLTKLVLGPDIPAYTACKRRHQSDSEMRPFQHNGLDIIKEFSVPQVSTC